VSVVRFRPEAPLEVVFFLEIFALV
jgi:hypothetical protein